jgi:DNA modification methylase
MEQYVFSSQINFNDSIGKIKGILRFNVFYPKLKKEIYSTIRRRNKTLKDGTKKYRIGDKYLVHINKKFNHIAQIIDLRKICLEKINDKFLKEDTNTESREKAYDLIKSVYQKQFNFEKDKFIILRLRKVKINILTQLEVCKLPYINIPRELMEDTIILGDLFRIEKIIQTKTFDLIIIDPPFNISQKRIFTRNKVSDINLYFGKWDDFGKGLDGFNNYLSYIYNLMDRIYRVLKEKGTIAVFCADLFVSFIRLYLKYHLNMKIKGIFVWCKSNPAPRFHKNSFAQSTEYCIFAQKSKDSIFNFLGQNKMKNWEETATVLGDERLKNKKGKTLHPTQKPKKIIRKFIRVFSNKGDLIGDFMAGTFTVSVVAKEENRRFFGIEKEYNYFKYAKYRVMSAKINQQINKDKKIEKPIKFQRLSDF